MILSRAWLYGIHNIIAPITRIISLPIIFYYLDPEDFGIYSLVISFAEFIYIVSGNFSVFVFSQYFGIKDVDKKRLISTVIGTELCIAFVLMALTTALWPLLGAYVLDNATIPPFAWACILIAIPFQRLWQSCLNLIVLESKPSYYAIGQVANIVMNPVATILALYIFGIGPLSLFLGYLFGALATFPVALAVLYGRWTWHFERQFLSDMKTLFQGTSFSTIGQGLYTIFERNLLARFSGTHILGLYAHANVYPTMGRAASKSIVMVVQPISLMEARQQPPAFHVCRPVWTASLMMITALGIGSSLLGREIISLLTHGKFAESAIFVTFMCIGSLFEMGGLCPQSLYSANGKGRELAWITAVGIVAGVVSLFVTVPLFGPWGALVSYAVRTGVRWILMYVIAWRIWGLQFFEFPMILGQIAIVAAHYAVAWTDPTLWVRCGLAGLLTVVLGVGCYMAIRKSERRHAMVS